jgi:hypothetical protein
MIYRRYGEGPLPKKRDQHTGFTAYGKVNLKDLVDICCHMPSARAPCIQGTQLVVWHAVYEVVKQEMFGK